MTTTDGRRLAQLLVVVGLLLGLLAVHGLASGHHAAALPAVPLADGTSAAGSGQPRAPGLHDEPGSAAAVPGAAVVPGALRADVDGGWPCDGGCTDDLAALCLAVLSAGAAALAALVTRRTRPLPLPALPVAALPRPGPPLRLRPPDPVRDLCTSRT